MKYYIVSIFICLSAISLSAQDGKGTFRHQIVAGLNIGATAPMPIPVEVRSIDGYSPRFNPQLGYRVTYHPNASKWGIASGIQLDYKGMEAKASVKSLYTIVNDGENVFEGNFTGKNRTEVKSSYVTVPLLAVYQFSAKWEAHLGGYAAYLHSSEFSGNVSDGYIRINNPVGERTEISSADFNFGSEMNKFDFGLMGGAEYSFNKRFAINANVAWGLRPIFPSSFKGIGYKMYNIYGSVGLGYTL